jgi:hypothetical protein
MQKRIGFARQVSENRLRNVLCEVNVAVYLSQRGGENEIEMAPHQFGKRHFGSRFRKAPQQVRIRCHVQAIAPALWKIAQEISIRSRRGNEVLVLAESARLCRRLPSELLGALSTCHAKRAVTIVWKQSVIETTDETARPLCTVTDWLSAHRRRTHGVIQLAVRTARQRDLCPAH